MSKAHWLALTRISGLGGVTTRRLLQRFDSIESAFEASVEELDAVPRVSLRMAQEIKEAPLQSLEEELVLLDDEGIAILTWEDDAFPANLRATSDGPPLLFARGQVAPEDDKAVAIVGSRQASPAGLEIAWELGREMAARELTVVSGLALGIDTAAHEGTLAADGRTLAVLGSGLRSIHPSSNRLLAQRIEGSGTLLSELHPSTPPSGRHLMARDRIISGLALATIVVEAAEPSGSLDTARRAWRQKRVVFAVDGGSAGTSRLLDQGAERLPTLGIDYDALAARVLEQLAEIRRPPGVPPQQLSLWPE
jgi:DNA processing protein